MRIKKHGNMFDKKPEEIKVEKFKCGNCGCEFTCKDDEYYVDLCGADNGWTTTYYTSLTYTIGATVKDYLVCSCPECHKVVKKIRERVNINYTCGGVTAPLDTTITCNASNLELF